MADENLEADPPGWRAPTRPAPEPPPPPDTLGAEPAHLADASPDLSPPRRPGQHLRDRLRGQSRAPVTEDDLRQAGRRAASSTRGSTDEPPGPVATSEGLEELGQTLLLAISKFVNYVMRRRSHVDWRMTPGEAASIARPATRMLSRRMQVRSDLADATDVGRGADGLLSYVFRILQGESPDELTAQWAAEQDRAPRHLRTVEPEQQATPAESFQEVGRDAAPVGASAGAAPTGGPTKSFFAGGFEDV